MNVVPRSTGNTNSGTRELTLKCKFKTTLCRFTQLIYYANKGKKCVAFPPLGRMLFRLLAGSGSQAKKRKRLLSVWVKISRLVIPYPV